MRSWSKLMGLETIRKPPGRTCSGDAVGGCLPGRFFGAAGCWARATLPASTLAFSRLAPDEANGKVADLWLGGDVSLGDGGRGQLQGISGIVQGATGIVNLEGPVAERGALKSDGLR